MDEGQPPDDRRGDLDKIDTSIVGILARDARLSARAIARELGVAPGTILERIERLQQRGVIRGYHADVDPAAIGFPAEFLVGLQTTQTTPLDETLDRLIEVPQVMSAAIVTGPWDIVLHLRARDAHELNELLVRGIWRWPDFRHSETMLVLDRRDQKPDWFESTGEAKAGLMIDSADRPDESAPAKRAKAPRAGSARTTKRH